MKQQLAEILSRRKMNRGMIMGNRKEATATRGATFTTKTTIVNSQDMRRLDRFLIAILAVEM